MIRAKAPLERHDERVKNRRIWLAVNKIRTRNFAVIVATPDDPIVKRGEAFDAIRDNLVFELGLFMGAIGRRRAFLMVPRHKKLTIPSDLSGLTHVQYDEARFQGNYQDKQAAIQTACLDLRAAIRAEWGRRMVVQQRELRRVVSGERLRSIRRLFDLIVKLRDILIVLPTQLIESLSAIEKFNRVKQNASTKVDEVAALFRDDAKVADLVAEFEELVVATKTAIGGVPYPSEILVTRAEVEEILKSYSAASVAKAISGENPFRDLGTVIESGIQSRLEHMARRYDDWWTLSKQRIEVATKNLSDALTLASVTLAQSSLSDGFGGAPSNDISA